MPRKLERKLRRQARAKGYSAEHTERYVYGTLNRVKRERRRNHKR